MFRFFILLAYLWITNLDAADKNIKLKYVSNIPVLQTSELKIVMLNSLPGVKLHEENSQVINAFLSIVSDQQDKIFITPPLDVMFTLKSYVIDLNINDRTARFHSEEPEKLPHLMQSYKMVDRPLKLRISKDCNFKASNEGLQSIYCEYPALKEIQIENFLYEWFQHLFALAGKDIYVGAIFDVPINVNQREGMLHYEIKSITDQEIQAGFNGKLREKILHFSNGLQENCKGPERMEMTVNGTTNGTVTWNRHNALVYSFQAKHLIKSTLSNGEESWTLNVNLTHHFVSKEV